MIEVATTERPWAREVDHAADGDCPVCFYGTARRCRSRWHRQVLAAVTPRVIHGCAISASLTWPAPFA